MSTSARAVIDRMPGQLAEAAVLDAGRRGVTHLTTTGIDWRFVDRVREQIRTSARAAVVWGMNPDNYWSACQVAGMPKFRGTNDIRQQLAPSFPCVRINDALLLARGFAPVEVLYMRGVRTDALTAHRYFREWGHSPTIFVIRTITNGIPIPDNCVRSIAAAHWVRAVWRRGDWPALVRRFALGDDGIRIPIADVMDDDLVRGSATGVRVVAESVMRRIAARDAGAEDPTPLATIPNGWVLPPGARALLSRADLTREGREMRHCVGSYYPAVAAGQCVVVALDAGGKRSTLEIGVDGEIRQHSGPGNMAPDPACVALAAEVVAAVKRGAV